MRSLGATENKWCAVFEKEQSNSTVKLGDVKSGWDKRSLECRLERGKIATSPLTSKSEVQLSFLQQTRVSVLLHLPLRSQDFQSRTGG